MKKPEQPWSVPVALDDIPETGLHMEIKAPAAVRAGVAALAAVRDIPWLSAVFDLTRRGARAHVIGQVSALVGQNCVVSLEPMETQVTEAIDVSFAPAAAEALAGKIGDGQHARADEEPPEPLIDGKLDVGALATEFLLLGIDPYPRKPGVEFTPPKVADSGEHPFAALGTLKKRLGGRQS